MNVSPGRVVRLAALAVVLAVGVVPAANAGTPGTPKLHPPTLLWKSYPLVQRSVRRTAASPGREASGPTVLGHRLDQMLLLTELLAISLAVGAVVFLRPTAVRAGGSLRGRVGPRTPRLARRPQRRPPRATEPSPPTAPEAASDIAVEPREDQPAAAPEPPDSDLERALDDLLEALEPTEQHARAPELELRELILRKHAAPESTRPRIEREIDAALERIATRRRAAEARRREAQHASLARSEIRLWRGHVKSQLYVTMAGSEHAVAVSQYFRMRDDDAPGAQAEEALATLLAVLGRAGWTVVAHGPKWYDRTLELYGREDTDTRPPDEDGLPRVVYRAVPKHDDEAAGGDT